MQSLFRMFILIFFVAKVQTTVYIFWESNFLFIDKTSDLFFRGSQFCLQKLTLGLLEG